jgi:hypothetical protein
MFSCSCSLSLQEGKYNRRNNNLLFGVSVDDLRLYRKGERMILMKRRKPVYRTKERNLTL